MDNSSTFSDNTSRKRDIYAFITAVISQFFWAMSNIQLKTYKIFFPEHFSIQNLIFWRSLSILVIGYIMVKKKNIEITPLSQVKSKFWFYLRNIGNYVFIILWILELTYFRVSTCQCFANCSPIVVLFLSLFILHEQFYIRYVFGVLASLLGTIMIVTNDKRDTSINLKNKTTFDMCVGVTIALSHMTFVAFSHFGQKMLCEEKMPPEVQNYYMGLINTLPAFVVMLIEGKTGITNLWYVLYAFSNGVIFYLASYYMAEALSIMAINKFIPMNYLRVVFIFIFGFIILGEHVFFTDIIGSALIIGFQVYNVCYPVKKIKNEKQNNENNNIKENFIKEIEK